MTLPLRWRLLLVLFTVNILVLSLMPSPPSDGLGWDKANHVVAMIVITVSAYLAVRPAKRAVVFSGFYAILLGVLIEVLQAVCTTGRKAEWSDLVADAVGVIIALVLVNVWLKRKVR